MNDLIEQKMKEFRKFIGSSIVWDRSYEDGFNEEAVEAFLRKAMEKAQAQMFNRIWDASNVENEIEQAYLIVKELNAIRNELTNLQPTK